jgi:hypothetical protein
MNSGTLALFILISSLILVGCQKAVPEIENLRYVPGFTLNQKSFSVSNKTNPTFLLNGKCNSKFSSIEVSMDGGVHWMPLSAVTTALSFDCASLGTFTSSLAFTSLTLDVTKWSASGVYSELAVRGVSPLGYSEPLSLELINQKGALGSITPGGSNTPLTGTGYKLNGELSAFNTSPAMSGGDYKLQGEVQW